MEFKLKRLIFMTSVVVSGSLAQAAGPNEWLWDQSQGPLTAANCQERTEVNSPFAVKPAGSAIDDAAGTSRALLLTPTDIKALNTKAAAHLKDIGDYVLQLPADRAPVKIGKTDVALASSFWQAAEGPDGYIYLSCGTGSSKTNYLAFDVFVSNSSTAVARIGVNPAQASIFKDVDVLTPDEAENAASNPQQAAKATKPAAQATAATTSVKKPNTKPTPAPDASKEKSTTKPPASSKPAPTATPVQHAAKPEAQSPNVKSSAQKPQPVSETREENEGDNNDALDDLSDVPVIGGPLAYVICSLSNSVQVLDQSLNNVIFQAPDLTDARPMQSFDDSNNARVKASHRYVKVTLPSRPAGQNTGWVDEKDVQLRSKCPYLENRSLAPVPLPESRTACCNFPSQDHPVSSYRTGVRRFRAARAKGRLHAACDLYRPNAEPIGAVANGRVIRSKYYFYQGVYALEVLHAGGFVVRYGEILGKSAPHVSEGDDVKMGQPVGYVGTVNSGCCKPMLHFELYKGNAKGSLTERWQHGFQRRSDLLDPTPYLSDWEKRKFGSSY